MCFSLGLLLDNHSYFSWLLILFIGFFWVVPQYSISSPSTKNLLLPPIKNHPLVHLCHVELQETRLKLKQMLSARPVGVAWVEKDLQLTADMNDHEWFDMISNIRDHISKFSRNYLWFIIYIYYLWMISWFDISWFLESVCLSWYQYTYIYIKHPNGRQIEFRIYTDRRWDSARPTGASATHAEAETHIFFGWTSHAACWNSLG